MAIKKTSVGRGCDGRKLYRWEVEIAVSETWVEDGFDLTRDRLLDMLSKELGYAYGYEYSGRIMASPYAVDIRKAQGYKK